MATANITIYHVWGTKNSYETLVEYKGATVKAFPDKALDAALAWAKDHGYTHYCYNNNQRKPL